MVIEMRLEVLGEAQLVRRLSRFGENVKDFRPAFETIVDRLRVATEELFDAEGRGWPPLSPKYAAWKEIHYPGQPIMRRTDTLYGSLVGRTGGSILEIQPLEMRWGTSVDYARYHQQGAGVPQRRVINLAENEKVGIMKELQIYLVKLLRD